MLVLFDSFVPNVAIIDNAAPRQRPLRTQLSRWTAKIRYHCSALGLLRLHEWPAYVLGLGKRISQRALSVAEHGPAKRQHSWHMERVNAAINDSRKRYMPGPYAGKVDYFCVAQVKEIGLPLPHLGWIDLARGGLQVYVVPGWHSHMLREPFVRALAPILRACLDRREVNSDAEKECLKDQDTISGKPAMQASRILEDT